MGPGELMKAIPATALVFMVGIGVAYLFGSWLGRIAGWRRGARGRALTFLAVTTYTIFPPFLGFILVYVLRNRLADVRNGVLGSTVDWLGVDRAAVMGRMTITIVIATLLVFTVGAVGARVSRKRRSLPLPGRLALVVGVSVGWWAYRGMLGVAIDVLFLAAVPTIAFAVLSYGDFLLVMRTSIAAVRHEDYVMAATAKGLSDRVVRDHHAARNAVLPVLGRLVVSLPYLLSGLIIIEESVGWAGMGTLLFDAVSAQDMPVVMDILLLIGVFTLVVRLVFEIMQAVLDPRIWRAA
ncbi:glutathione transport system permease protein GsiC [bacterium BMS3Abin02]|nr:glutathione transport system permease protein GsiC [bacterium BMS3Abin02]GBE22357.1 glutathione transport system permease protein GsiC [bacterium BMS3Bbin01]